MIAWFKNILKDIFGVEWNMELIITDDEPTEPKAPAKGRKGLGIGINDYPGRQNDLRGCVNDCKRWAKKATSVFGFTMTTLLNKKATKRNIKAAIAKLMKESKAGDEILITYSGHGTRVVDRNGDEADGYDEAICCYDGNLTDDELRNLFSRLHPKAHLTFISDSCHSGTVSRSMLMSVNEGEGSVRVRYMPPQDEEEVALLSTLPGTASRGFSQEKMKEVLFTGCLPTEYSYDAYFGGKFFGAFSYNALNELDKNPDVTSSELFQAIRGKLPSGQYPQTPQLEGARRKLNRPFLGGPIG